MEFFNSAIEVLQTLVVALGAGLGVWGGVNLLEGYGSDNPGSNGEGLFFTLFEIITFGIAAKVCPSPAPAAALTSALEYAIIKAESTPAPRPAGHRRKTAWNFGSFAII